MRRSGGCAVVSKYRLVASTSNRLPISTRRSGTEFPQSLAGRGILAPIQEESKRWVSLLPVAHILFPPSGVSRGQNSNQQRAASPASPPSTGKTMNWLEVLAIAGALFVLGRFLRHLYSYVALHDGRRSFRALLPNGRQLSLPFLQKTPSCSLSLVIPAFNEEKRIRRMLEETLSWLKKELPPGETFEVIVVDDGSRDATVDVVRAVVQEQGLGEAGRIKILQNEHNRGKGCSVRRGVLCSQGAEILFLDADGATEISELARLRAILRQDLKGHGLVIGSRAHLVEEAMATRSAFRNVLMHGFHLLVSVFCVSAIKDTQCGFKLFSRDEALRLFEHLHIERWGFDVELLYRAQRMHIPVVEVPVRWEEVDGSKLNVATASLAMARDCLAIPLLYRTSLWRLNRTKSLVQ